MNYPFSPPPRLLMGPGPSNVSPEVLAPRHARRSAISIPGSSG